MTRVKEMVNKAKSNCSLCGGKLPIWLKGLITPVRKVLFNNDGSLSYIIVEIQVVRPHRPDSGTTAFSIIRKYINITIFRLDETLDLCNPRGHQLTKKWYGFQNLEQISQDFTGFKRFRKIERELQNLILNYRLV